MQVKTLMIQGTASSVGKSVITAGLCRCLAQDGYRVAPFKAQNMSLNSFPAADGGEMGRAQVVQAEACGMEPSVLMNPILLKPTGDRKSQVIVMGKVWKELSAAEYEKAKPMLRRIVESAYQQLASQCDVVVIEGAGSPAEINLKKNDLVNMGMARMADAPVLLVGDIDRGGVFASLAGTMMLLEDDERQRIKGVIINKFRGDPAILQPGLNMLKKIVRVPVLGVIPYNDPGLDEEDGAVELKREHERLLPLDKGDRAVRIRVIKLPRMSNFTDFAELQNRPDVDLVYIDHPSQLTGADLVVIPGSKNTIADLIWMKKSGLAEAVLSYHEGGGYVVGLCGGYQMLGRKIHNPYLTEGETEMVEGLGLLDVITVFGEYKTTTQVTGKVLPNSCGLLDDLQGAGIKGYEIHIGETRRRRGRPLFSLERIGGEKVKDGAASSSGRVFGTYVHGIFDSPGFAEGLLTNLKRANGLQTDTMAYQTAEDRKEENLNRAAALLRANLDMKKIYRIIGLKI